MEGLSPFRWLWRRRWVLPLQNFAFEIDAVRSELDELEKEESLDDEKKEILNKCRTLLEKTESAFEHYFPRELFIWQMLFRIHQDIFLIAPRRELPSRCFVLRKRLDRLGQHEKNASRDRQALGWEKWKELVREAEENLEASKDRKQHDMKWRSNLKAACRFLDDQIILELWKSSRLRRQSRIFIIFAVLLSGLLVAHISFDLWAEDCADCIASERPHSPILMFIAGTLGAFVSMLMSSSIGPERGAPLANVSIVRPILGGVAGLFLYLTSEIDVIRVNFPALYAGAVAFGFSERAFSATLTKLAGETEKNIEARRAK